MVVTTLEPIPRIAIDESGNTGEDLLNAEQPTFVLASTSLSDENAIALIESAGGHRDVELKHSKIRKSREGREQIARVVNGVTPDIAKVIVINKRFMIVAKMVDDLIEPLASATGFNLYGRGVHTVLSELWFHAFPAVLGEGRFRELLENFVQMCRHPEPASIGGFYSFVGKTRTGMRDVDDDLRLLGATRDVVVPSLASRLRDGLDPAIPALFNTANEWGESLGVPFIIDHDEAAVIERWYPHLRQFFFAEGDRTVIGTGARSFSLPLMVTDVELVSSTTNHAVQVVDVLAGATRRWLDTVATGRQADSEDVGETELLPLVFNTVWPTGDLSPDESALQSVNPADQGARYLAERRARGI